MNRFGYLALALMFCLAGGAQAASFKLLHRFTGSPGDGDRPESGVILDGTESLYGTTEFGGTGPCITGCGTVYKIAPDGTETILHSFQGRDTDGNFPQSKLVMDADGNLYGATSNGGGVSGCYSQGCGTVFMLAPDGTETILHDFIDDGTDGTYPETGLVRDAQGNLYGGTLVGGAYTRGVIFKIAPDGTETILHAFAGETAGDTGTPVSLMADARGNLYGTTAPWDRTDCGVYCGAVFKITPKGAYSLLHVFTGGTDGAEPYGRMVLDRSHNLIGTAQYGGASGFGTVFKIAPDGTFSTVYAFPGGSERWSNTHRRSFDRGQRRECLRHDRKWWDSLLQRRRLRHGLRGRAGRDRDCASRAEEVAGSAAPSQSGLIRTTGTENSTASRRSPIRRRNISARYSRYGLDQPIESISLNHISAAATSGRRRSWPPGNGCAGTRAMTSKRSGLPSAASAISLPPSVASATPCPE